MISKFMFMMVAVMATLVWSGTLLQLSVVNSNSISMACTVPLAFMLAALIDVSTLSPPMALMALSMITSLSLSWAAACHGSAATARNASTHVVRIAVLQERGVDVSGDYSLV